jgi:NitT/TauT family transport system substrate-binding protein
VLDRSLDLVSPTWFHNGLWGRLRSSHIKPYAAWLAEHGILRRPDQAPQAFVDLSSASGQADARVA